MARMLIAINKSSSKSATNQFQFDDESLQCFAEKVTTLPVGQVLDLWKTFEYHLKNVSNGGNKLIDQLMSTFILHACIVEQAIPEPTMDKIEANI